MKIVIELSDLILLLASWIVITFLITVNCYADPVHLDDRGLCTAYLEIEVCKAKLYQTEMDETRSGEFFKCDAQVIRRDAKTRVLWDICADNEMAKAFEKRFGLKRLDFDKPAAPNGGPLAYMFLMTN